MAKNRPLQFPPKKLPVKLALVKPEKNQGPQLITGLVIITSLSLGTTGYLGYQNHLLKKQLFSFECPAPSPAPSPTSAPEPGTSALLDSVLLTYDESKYETSQEKYYNYGVPSLSVRILGQRRPVFQIVDLTKAKNYSENKEIKRLLGFYGRTEESDLREVVIGGETYSFTKDRFEEGGLVVDGCSEGIGVEQHYFKLDQGLGIVLVNDYTIKICNGKRTLSYTFDEEAVEEALEIVESIRFK